MLACCAAVASSYAQDVPVNREKYPDYVDPQKAYPSEPRLMKFVPQEGESQSRKAARAAAREKLPEYWNNADTKYFPPVFNQDGGSCGSASRICYMFTHEINALRDADASLPENQYPSHFVWLLTSGNSGKDAFVEYVGVPNVTHYGGRTYSSLFGYQEETNNYFGWMTGYDNWMNAIGNRMLRPTSNPLTVDTEEGRQAAKAWLYNHAGDLDFKTGGLIGLGVASGGQWHPIPNTAANKAAGVAGQYYVHRWGTQVDHAVTMVGWDDRIEFDLDGNGVAGEVSKDEKGAWIIVNSWGNWCNAGFIYCPYKYAGPVSDPTTGAMTGGYWSGELYHARKNFRPTRVIKLKMDYTHRSELLLQVGISSDLNATEPESLMDMHHFRYAGDGANGDANPAPAIPMLGKWQSKWHEEPMEFCYDVTDFSAAFDQNKPLKYFFVITRKKDANQGRGNVYAASIVDLERDLAGIETPFDLGGEKFQITKEGKRLMISCVVYGNGYEPANNLSYSDGVLSWDAPKKSSYNVASYNVYKDGALCGNTTETTYAIDAAKEYAVSVVYEDGTESAKILCTSAVESNDVAVALEGAGFTIPNVFTNHYKDCTIEFFINPTRFVNWNCAAGPGWGTYMHHFNSNGTFTCGWNTNARVTSSTAFALNSWQHVAIVVSNNKMTLYKDATAVGSVSTNAYSGLGGFGDLVFSASGEGSYQNAKFDEIRIWDHARTQTQLKGSSIRLRRQEFTGEVMPQGLVAYYKGDTFEGEDGKFYMRDCVGGNHAVINNVSGNPEETSTNKIVATGLAASLKLNSVGDVYAGTPVTLTATRGDGLNSMWWTIPSCGMNKKKVIAPTVTFTEVGEHKVIVGGTNTTGKEYSDSMIVNVVAAPALDASFTMSAESLPCGEQLSMIVNNYFDACSYEWILPGAEKEVVYGAKAGASYLASGTYDVTLKIVAADGRVAESTQQVRVTGVAPKPDFNISENVVLKGTPITLNSTSRYGATDFEWKLKGQAQTTIITSGREKQTWTPTYPGKYDITLKASNSIGSNEITKTQALVVVNDDSENGLNFSQPSARVTFPNTFDNSVVNLLSFTIDFWANPNTLSGSCMGIGNDENSLKITVNATGAMIVSINGTTIKSAAGFVEAGQWNHYAIRRSTTGALSFYRNGERISYVSTSVNKNAIKGMAEMSIGLPDAPMTGGIDEFRFWASDFSGLNNVCNQHMDDASTYVDNNRLLVYFDFNQTGGDVIDRTGNGNHGVRTGFGPDGDAWGLSKGVFSLYLGDKLSDETITSVDELLQDVPVTAGLKGVYTLSGQYVGNSIEGLPAGLYIVDGQKVSIK